MSRAAGLHLTLDGIIRYAGSCLRAAVCAAGLLAIVMASAQAQSAAPSPREAEANRLFQEAYDLQQQGQHARAIEKFREGLVILPGNVLAHWLVAQSYEALGHVERAIDHYATVTRLAPDSQEGMLAETKARRLAAARGRPDPQDERADEAAWGFARSAGAVAAFRSYLEQYPAGRYVEAARSAIRDIERRQREAAPARAAAPASEAAPAQPTMPAPVQPTMPAPVQPTLLNVVARGRWAVGSTAGCSRGVEATYRAEVTGNQIIWHQGTTKKFVEQIEEDAAQFARTVSIFSTLPGASNDNVGTRWQYVLVSDGTIRVERTAKPSFIIVRCPGT